MAASSAGEEPQHEPNEDEEAFCPWPRNKDKPWHRYYQEKVKKSEESFQPNIALSNKDLTHHLPKKIKTIRRICSTLSVSWAQQPSANLSSWPPRETRVSSSSAGRLAVPAHDGQPSGHTGRANEERVLANPALTCLSGLLGPLAFVRLGLASKAMRAAHPPGNAGLNFPLALWGEHHRYTLFRYLYDLLDELKDINDYDEIFVLLRNYPAIRS